MRKPAVTLLILATIMLLLVGCGKQEEEQKTAKESLVPVEVIKVTKSDLSKEIEMTGEVVPGEEVTITPKVSGRVVAVHTEVGQSVNQGAAIFEIDDTDYQNQLANAQAGLSIAEINLEQTQKEYDRYKQLYDAQAISQADFEKIEYALKTAQANVEQAKVNLHIAQSNCSEVTVTSPIAGKIAALNVRVGEIASQQVPAAVVVSLNPAKIKLNMPESLVGNIKLGQKVKVEIAAIGKTLEGTITSVAPKADQQTKSFPVEVQIPNNDQKIFAGMVAKLQLSTGTVKNAIAVPHDAVIDDNGIKKIFVVEDGVAKERIVTLGVKSIDKVQIVEGLKENEQVIVKGNRLVGDGQKVKIVNKQTTDKSGVN